MFSNIGELYENFLPSRSLNEARNHNKNNILYIYDIFIKIDRPHKINLINYSTINMCNKNIDKHKLSTKYINKGRIYKKN